MSLMRVALWLFAALSLAEFAPAFGEFSRFARLGLAQAECFARNAENCSAAQVQVQVVASEPDAAPSLAVAEIEPCLDGDEDGAACGIKDAGKAANAGCIWVWQCLDE